MEHYAELQPFKSSRRGGHDVCVRIGKKKYGCTTAESDELSVMLQEFGTFENVLSMARQGWFISPMVQSLCRECIKQGEKPEYYIK